MTEVCINPKDRARKMQSFILQRITGRQSEIATALGVSESTISRMKGDQLELFCSLLAHAGIKAVPQELKCYDARQIDALFVLARSQMNRAETADEVLT